MAVSPQRSTLPALLSMKVGGFAIGTTEYASVGVLPQIADDFGINLARAGLVVSGYALGVSFGSPILAALTGNLSRKTLMLAVMALFVLANAAAALSASYEFLIVARIVSALPHGIFFGVGAAIAASLVGEDRRASAVAIVFGGLTIAVAAGVPIATVIGQRLGWPMTYWFVAAIGLVSLLAMAATLPRKIDIAPAGGLIEQVKVLGSGRLLIAFGMNFCAWGGTFVAFAYLPSILADITGFGPNGVAWMLALYGVSVIVGNFLGGRVSDKKVVPALALMLGAQAAVLLIFTFTASSMLGSILTLGVLGALMFCNVPGLALYVVQLAQRHRPGNVDIASTINVSAANAGIALGAFIGGLVADSRLGLGATPWVGALMVGVGLLLTLWSGRSRPLNMSGRIPRRVPPAFQQEIAEHRQPARHGFAPRAHDADLRGRGFPFRQHAHQPPVAQFLVDVPGLAQRDSQPGQAPGMQHVAAVAAQRAADRDRLLPPALTQRPGALQQARIGEYQAIVLRQFFRLRGLSMRFQVVGRRRQDAPVAGHAPRHQPRIGQLAHADRQVQVAAVQILHLVGQWIAGATYLRPNGVGAVRRMMPRRSRLPPVASSCTSSSTPSAIRARSAMARPSSVMRRLRVLRSNSVVPSACSSRAICLLTVFGARCRSRAAAEKLCRSITCTNTARSSRLRRVIWADPGKVFVD
jgi:DHA1 family inner membrane transport protein